MKSFYLLTFCFFTFIQQHAYGKQCFSYLLSQNPKLYITLKSRINQLKPQDRAVLETLAYMHLGHDNLDDFLQRGFLDFQFYDTPNIQPAFKRKGLHYKLMMHYPYGTQTIIYNSETFEVIDRSVRENF